MKPPAFPAPLVGASIGPGVQPLQDFLRLKLGGIVLTTLPDSLPEAVAAMRFCREHKIRVMLAEIVHRHNHERWHTPSLGKAEIEAALAEAGEFFIGRYVIGEAGGMLYWPKFYTINEAVHNYPNLPPCDNEQQAHDAYVRYLKRELDYERREVCDAPLFDAESSIVFSAHVEAGVDGLCLEMCPGDPLLALAAIRGAARASRLPWGVHIAQMWYGGTRVDELWQKRWRTHLWLSYLAGAEFIYPESGHLVYTIKGETNYPFNAPEMRRVRRELRRLHQFTRVHRRPDGGPDAPFAVVRADTDGHPGLWNPYAWGQYERGRAWESSDDERGWELFPALFTRESAFHEYNQGDADFSGNPPAGQIDVIPPNADFSRHQMLFFLGYNAMDERLYDKLCRYVEAGGHLFIALSHLCTQSPRRQGPKALFNDGDLTRLCGFRVTDSGPADVHGILYVRQCSDPAYDFPAKNPTRDPEFNARFTPLEIQAGTPQCRVLAGCTARLKDTVEAITRLPVLVEHRLGKGLVLTLTTQEAPGAPALRDFVQGILRAAVRAHRPPLDFLAGDRVRHALYRRDDGGLNCYLYNTDSDLTQGVVPVVHGRRLPELLLPPGALRVGFFLDDLLFLPDDPLCDLERTAPGEYTLHTKAQPIVLHNLGEPRDVVVNGTRLSLDGTVSFQCPASIPTDQAPFFDPAFLDEPEFDMRDTTTPY